MAKTKKDDDGYVHGAQTTVAPDNTIVEGTAIQDPTSPEVIGPRTGPNVDAGLVDGVVTVDPQTAEGQAAEAARKANGAKTTEVSQDTKGATGSIDPKAQVVSNTDNT